jgi:pyrimidine-nucleoside phosphorylase
MDTTALGWAVQRTGAGREKAGEPGVAQRGGGGSSSLGWEPVDPHAGILFHARRGARVEKGQPFATIYATNAEMLAEPEELIRKAVVIAQKPPRPVELVEKILTLENAKEFLAAHGGR